MKNDKLSNFKITCEIKVLMEKTIIIEAESEDDAEDILLSDIGQYDESYDDLIREGHDVTFSIVKIDKELE